MSSPIDPDDKGKQDKEEQEPVRRNRFDDNSDDSSDDEGGDADADVRIQVAVDPIRDARLRQQLHEAEGELDRARWEEHDHLQQKRGLDLEEGDAIPQVAATWSFWKGSDWTDEEKRTLRTAQATITGGVLVGMGTLTATALSVAGARETLLAADARLDADNTTANEHAQAGAQLGLAQAGVTLYAGVATFIGLLASGVLMYYNTCAKHAENVKALNAPEVTQRRERLERWVAHLRDQLGLEDAELKKVI